MPCNLSLFIQYNHIVELDSFCFVFVFSCFYRIPSSLSLFIQYDNIVELDALYTTGRSFIDNNNTVQLDSFYTIQQ